jgi:hypothetical protein
MAGIFLPFNIFTSIARQIAQVLHICIRTVVEKLTNDTIAFSYYPIAPTLCKVVPASVFFAT